MSKKFNYLFTPGVVVVRNNIKITQFTSRFLIYSLNSYAASFISAGRLFDIVYLVAVMWIRIDCMQIQILIQIHKI